MANKKISTNNVERHNVSFTPEQWNSYVELSKTLELKAVSELFRALYNMYIENKTLMHPFLIKTIEKNNNIRAENKIRFDNSNEEGIGAFLTQIFGEKNK